MSADWSGLFGTPVAGGLYALGSAAAWALGSILFRQLGDAASPLGLNLGKGLVGLLYLGAAVLLFGHTQLDTTSLTYLALSGLIGIAVGDTLFFMALVRLDPRITVLLATVGQVFTVVLGMAWLGERHATAVWPGILLILGGVAWVLMERSEDEQRDSAQRRDGVLYGLLSALCMSVGLILAKLGVQEVSALQATFVRLAAGVMGLLVWGTLRGQVREWLAPFRDRAIFLSLLLAAFVIIFGGFYLSLLAIKVIDVSIATVLNSTEPLFVLPLAAILLRERISLRACLGATVAVMGVVLVLHSYL